MGTVENDQYVQVHYKGTLDSGEEFDSSRGRQPMEVHMGQGQLIKGFENAVLGMALNEKKTFTLSPQEAYGERDERLEHTFNRCDLPPDAAPQVGDTVGLQNDQGQQFPAQVTDVNEECVVVDLNHPLAGKALTFEIEVVAISDQPSQNNAAAGCSCCGSVEDAGCGSQGSCCH